MNLTGRKEANEIKRSRRRGKARFLTAFSVLVVVIGYWILSTTFVAEDAFVQAAYRHMEVKEREALEGYPGLLEVRRERIKNSSIASPGGWQAFHRWLCWTNGGYAVRVTYPDTNPQFGSESRSLYFNPNTREWIGYGRTL